MRQFSAGEQHRIKQLIRFGRLVVVAAAFVCAESGLSYCALMFGLITGFSLGMQHMDPKADLLLLRPMPEWLLRRLGIIPPS